MAHLEVFEGTWEELVTYAEVFQGRRLRLIVLPVVAATTARDTDEPRLRETAIQLFAEADGIEREPGRSSNDPYKATFGEIIAEKYRQMGLKL